MTTDSADRSLPRDSVTTDLAGYELQRAARRRHVGALLRARRLRLGDRVVLEFLDQEAPAFLAQEALADRGESGEAAVSGVLAAFGRLLPTRLSIAARLLVEYADEATLPAELRRLKGIEDRVGLVVAGETVPAHPVAEAVAAPEPGIALQHFLRFALTERQADLFRDPAQVVEVLVEHPQYADGAVLDGTLRNRLIADLGPAPG